MCPEVKRDLSAASHFIYDSAEQQEECKKIHKIISETNSSQHNSLEVVSHAAFFILFALQCESLETWVLGG